MIMKTQSPYVLKTFTMVKHDRLVFCTSLGTNDVSTHSLLGQSRFRMAQQFSANPSTTFALSGEDRQEFRHTTLWEGVAPKNCGKNIPSLFQQKSWMIKQMQCQWCPKNDPAGQARRI